MEDFWVQCDACGKWRTIPATEHIDETLRWQCSMHSDPEQRSCNKSEERWRFPPLVTFAGKKEKGKESESAANLGISEGRSSQQRQHKRRRTDCHAIWKLEASASRKVGGTRSNPSRGVEPSRKSKELARLIVSNDASVEVLRLSERLDKAARSCDIIAVLDALMVNDNCQALYIHNQVGLVSDPDGLAMRKLVEVLKRGNIWALNIGETEMSYEAWECFADALEETNVTHMFAELEDQRFREIKTRIRKFILRPNRCKHDRHKAIDNREIICQINNMWWNPDNGREFKAKLEQRRLLVDWQITPSSKLTTAQITESHDLSEELDGFYRQEAGGAIDMASQELVLSLNTLRRSCLLFLQSEGLSPPFSMDFCEESGKGEDDEEHQEVSQKIEAASVPLAFAPVEQAVATTAVPAE